MSPAFRARRAVVRGTVYGNSHGPLDGQVEAIARRIASAFGHGSSWRNDSSIRHERSGSPEDEHEGAAERLPVCRRGDVEERRRDLLSENYRLTDDQKQAAGTWAAEANPRQSGERADRVRQFRSWRVVFGQTTTPQNRMDTTTLGAWSYAHLPAPHAAWLRVFALEDWRAWGTVERYATACGYQPLALRDAAARLLWRRAPAGKDTRARGSELPRAQYRSQTNGAEHLLRSWLQQAAKAIERALRSAKSHPAEHESSKAPNVEASREQTMNLVTVRLDDADRDRIDRMTKATERLEMLLAYESRPRSPGVLRLHSGPPEPHDHKPH